MGEITNSTPWLAYFPAILEGMGLTVMLALLSLCVAIVLGLLAAASKLSPFRLLRWLASFYTTIVRGIPDLVLMLLVFYGGQLVLNSLIDQLDWEPLEFDPFWAGTLTIGFIYGAFFGETFRGAFMTVPRGQLEAGMAYGMSRYQVFEQILVPQMLRYAIPGLGNNWLVLLKSTAIVSMLGLTDMTWLAGQAGRTTQMQFFFYMVVCVLYMLLSAVSGYALRRLEVRLSQGVLQGGL